MPLAFHFLLEELKIALFDRHYLMVGVSGLSKFFFIKREGSTSRIGEIAKNNPKNLSRFLFFIIDVSIKKLQLIADLMVPRSTGSVQEFQSY